MGNTRDSLKRGDNPALAFVLTIEGFDYLITSHDDKAAVATAYAATDWTDSDKVIRGLHYPGNLSQDIVPFEPKLDAAGMSFVIEDVDGDILGAALATQEKNGGHKTRLASDMNPLDTSATVVASGTVGFSQVDDIYIGNERIDYTNGTLNSFRGMTRGKYAPLKSGSQYRWARNHPAYSYTFGHSLSPEVSDWRKEWHGAWVALRVHRVVGGVLDTVAEAELVFAGKIAHVEDSDTGAVIITAEHVLSELDNVTLMQRQYRGRVKEGVYVGSNYPAGSSDNPEPTSSNAFTIFVTEEYRLNTSGSTLTVKNAKPFRFVASGASQPWEMNAGTHTLDELRRALAEWLRGEKDDGRLVANWHVSVEDTDVGKRFQFKASFNEVGGYINAWITVRLPYQIAGLFGFVSPEETASVKELKDSKGGTNHPILTVQGEYAPLRLYSRLGELQVYDYEGEWCRQPAAYTPEPWRTDWHDAADWDGYENNSYGFMMIEGDGRIFQCKNDGTDTAFTDLYFPGLSDLNIATVDLDGFLTIPYESTSDLIIKQVMLIDGPMHDVFIRLFESTGGWNYNGSRDTFDAQLGCAIPDSLTGANLYNSLKRLAVNTTLDKTTIVLDKPTKFSEVLTSELALRNAHLVWKDGALQIQRVVTPAQNEDLPEDIWELTTSNKATPTGSNQRDVSRGKRTEEFVRNQLKIDYGRDISGSYKHTLEASVASSIAELGQVKPITVKARNIIPTDGVEEDVEAFAADLIRDAFSQFAKPLTVVTRTIDYTLALAAPGDWVKFTDQHIRNPRTGLRGVTNNLGWIRSIDFDWDSGLGQAEIVLSPGHKAGGLSPGGKVDKDAFTHGWDVNTNHLGVKGDGFKTPDGILDAFTFEIGNTVQVYEQDPDTPDSPHILGEALILDIDTVGGVSYLELDSAITTPSGNLNYYVTLAEVSSLSTEPTTTYIAASGTKTVGTLSTGASVSADTYLSERTTTSGTATTSGTELYERHSSKFYTAGNPLSPIQTQAMGKNANALQQYHLAPCQPALYEASYSNLEEWTRIHTQEVYVGPNINPAGYVRKLYVAPMMYQSSGASASSSCRITLSTSLPKGDPTVSGSGDENVVFTDPYHQAEFGIFGTSPTLLEREGMLIPGKGPTVYMTVELKCADASATTYFLGTPLLHVGPYEAITDLGVAVDAKAQAFLAGVGSLEASAIVAKNVSADLSGSAALEAAASRIIGAGATLAGSADVTASALANRVGSATLAGTSSVDVSANVGVLIEAYWHTPETQAKPTSATAVISGRTASYIWDMEEASGNLTDEVNSIVLSATNSPITGQTAVGLFNGTNSYSYKAVEITSSTARYQAPSASTLNYDGTSSLAALVVFRMSEAGTVNIVDKRGGSTGWRIYHSGATLYAQVHDGTTGVTSSVAGNYVDGAWHCALIVIDATAETVQLFTDLGSGSAASIAALGSPSTGATFRFPGSSANMIGQYAYLAGFTGADAEGLGQTDLDAFFTYGSEPASFITGHNRTGVMTALAGRDSTGDRITAYGEEQFPLEWNATLTQGAGFGLKSIQSTTNLLPYSEDFTQWTALSGTLTADNSDSPMGFKNASLLTTASGVTNTHSLDVEASSSQHANNTSPSGLSPADDFSFEAWIRPESTGSTLGVFGTTNSLWTPFSISVDNTYVHVLIANSTRAPYGLRWAHSGDVATETWAHLAFTYDASGQWQDNKLYINGSDAGAGTVTQGTGTDTPGTLFSISSVSVGSTPATSNYFDGEIDDVRFWHSLRSSSEISNNYDTELTGSETNLEGYWKLNNSYADETSNGNDLTAQNSPTFNTDTPFGGAFNASCLETTASGLSTSKSHTFSVWLSDDTSHTAVIDLLVSGTVVATQNATVSGTWDRHSVTASSGYTELTCRVQASNSSASPATVKLWGAQLEEVNGYGYTSSYVRTNGASATCGHPGYLAIGSAGDYLDGNAGEIDLTFVGYSQDGSVDSVIVDFSEGSTFNNNYQVAQSVVSTGKVGFSLRNSTGTYQGGINYAPTLTEEVNIRCRWDSQNDLPGNTGNHFDIIAEGSIQGSDNSSYTGTNSVNKVSLGQNRIGTGHWAGGLISSLIVYSDPRDVSI